MLPLQTFFGTAVNKKPKKEKSIDIFEIEKEPGVENITDIVGGLLAQSMDLISVPEDEKDLIKTYRKLAQNSEIDLALNEIQNETFIFDIPGKKAFELSFVEESEISKSIKEKINDEFEVIYNLMDFKNKGIEYFMNWYVDGKIFFHKLYEKDNLKKGLKKIIYIDPLKIRKIREYPEPDKQGLFDISKIKTYFIFSEKMEYKNSMNPISFNRNLQIHPDAITYVDSGIYDRTENRSLSFLHKVIVPYNNLKLLEDSIIIYRVTRAPERRIFYVDVGNLPKGRAEQYVRELMNKFKTKLVYDSQSGTILDKKNVLSMIEDFWLPRRDGKGTQVDTLPSGNALGELNDAEHFKVKFWQSLNIPINRFTEQAPAHMFGKTTEIYREEYRFKKFIDKIRNRFMIVFEDILRTQLILKNIITPEEWDEVKNDIFWSFAEDNSFVESKELELIESRISLLQTIENYVGTYFSKDWVQRNILRMTEDQIKKMQISIEKETNADLNDLQNDATSETNQW